MGVGDYGRFAVCECPSLALLKWVNCLAVCYNHEDGDYCAVDTCPVHVLPQAADFP